MHKFYLSPEARNDLIEIQDFISLDNPAEAAKVIDRIFDIFEMLSENPLAGHKREDITKKNLRFWSVYSYLIVYEPKDASVNIIRVLSGFRDIGAMLDK